jgi:glycine/D-amino acid oxidase-like deaminating enzyme
MPIHSVAVLGAGIVGAAVAQAFASAGMAVTVIDADQPGAGTSGTGFAWLNANEKLPREYHDFSVRAMREWRRLAATFGHPDWYVPSGNVAWADTDERRTELTARVARLRDWGYPAENIGADALHGLEPRLRVPADAQIAYFPEEGFAHTDRAIDALLAHARARGAVLVQGAGTAVLESAGPNVTAVRLPDGDRIHADAYVCCAGWRTQQLLEPVGVRVPLVAGDTPGSTAPGLVADIATPHALLGRVVHAPDLSLRPTWPSGLRVDAEDINLRVHAATPPPEQDRYARELLSRARRVLPDLAAQPPVQARLCIRPLPVDGKPVVGRLPHLTNTYLIVCHSGVTLAPLLARLALTELTHGPETDLDQYRITRF